MSETVTVSLKHPIEAHGQTHDTLRLREPTLGALEDIGITVRGDGAVRLNLGDLHRLAADMAGIPPSAAKKIHLSDAVAIGKAAAVFLKEFLQCGNGAIASMR